jgi:hypothetical protein
MTAVDDSSLLLESADIALFLSVLTCPLVTAAFIGCIRGSGPNEQQNVSLRVRSSLTGDGLQ